MFSSHCKSFFTLLFALVVGAVMVPTTQAQTSQAIQGLVTDASGAHPGRLPDRNIGTGVVRTATRRKEGNYSFLLSSQQLQRPLRTEGFKVQTTTNIRRHGAQVRRFPRSRRCDRDGRSTAGAVTNTENAAVGTVIRTSVVGLPLNGHNIVARRAVPGVRSLGHRRTMAGRRRQQHR
jgi:hypothetical protein